MLQIAYQARLQAPVTHNPNLCLKLQKAYCRRGSARESKLHGSRGSKYPDLHGSRSGAVPVVHVIGAHAHWRGHRLSPPQPSPDFRSQAFNRRATPGVWYALRIFAFRSGCGSIHWNGRSTGSIVLGLSSRKTRYSFVDTGGLGNNGRGRRGGWCRFSELMKIRVRTPENFVSQLVKKSYSAGSWRVRLGESISYQAFKGRGP